MPYGPDIHNPGGIGGRSGRCDNALAMLGDPRFRADAWFLPDDEMLGFKEIRRGPVTMGTDEENIPHLLQGFGGKEE